MTPSALLFPGQGAQRPGMLNRLPRTVESTATLAEASEVLGRPLGPADTGSDPLDGPAMREDTVAIQSALLIAATAVSRSLTARGYEPDYVAGHSAGAFAAAVAAGVLEFSDALRLVGIRARLMAAEFPASRGFGTLVVTGLAERDIAATADEARSTGLTVYLSTVNALDQSTVSGSAAGLARVTELAYRRGARRIDRVATPVPSHSPLLASIVPVMSRELDALHRAGRLRAPRVPYVGTIDARALRDPRGIAADLAGGIARPVRWYDAISALYERGVRLFLEVSPGDVLARLASTSFPDVRAHACDQIGLESMLALARHRVAKPDENHPSIPAD